MRQLTLLMALPLLLCGCWGKTAKPQQEAQPQQPKQQQVSPGRLECYNSFSSPHFTDRTVLVWLPEGYNPEERYAVLYMHDGQMLFDAETSWNKKTWDVDAVAAKVQGDGRCRPFIVVGVENHAKNRLTEYMPEKVLNYLPAENELLKKFDRAAFIADDYLTFLVKELKPFIDSTYSTRPDAANTVVMGSSMGGLISLYALCEYPEVFGSAACLSTHTPVAIDDMIEQAPIWSKALRDYLNERLPAVGSNRIYMDHGDQTADALYPPFQKRVDALFADKGWGEENYRSLFFAGAAHDETSWQERLHIPLEWLLGAE